MSIEAKVDRDQPVREDVTLFNDFTMHFVIEGVSAAAGDLLVERFKSR